MRRFMLAALAVFKKDILITTRYKTWWIAMLIWPIIMPLTFVFVGKGLAGPSGEGLSNFTTLAGSPDYASFLILGNFIWMFVNMCLWDGGLSLNLDRQRGTFDTIWTQPAPRLAYILGRTLSSLAINFFPIIIATVFFNVFGMLSFKANIFAVLGVTLITFPFLLGFLFLFASLTLKVREAGIVVQVTRTLFSILCGLQFPLAVLPGFMQTIGKWIPLTQYMEVVRGMAILGKPASDYTFSLVYMLVSGIVFFIAGTLIFRAMERSVKRSGLVTGY